MRFSKAIALVSIGALVALGAQAAIAGPNPDNATGKRITQVKRITGRSRSGHRAHG